MAKGVEILTTEAVRLAEIFESAHTQLLESHAHIADQQYDPNGYPLNTLVQNHESIKQTLLTHIQEEIFQTHTNIREHTFQKRMFQPKIPANIELDSEIGVIAQKTLQAIAFANNAFIQKKQSEHTVKEQLSTTLHAILKK